MIVNAAGSREAADTLDRPLLVIQSARFLPADGFFKVGTDYNLSLPGEAQDLAPRVPAFASNLAVRVIV